MRHIKWLVFILALMFSSCAANNTAQGSPIPPQISADIYGDIMGTPLPVQTATPSPTPASTPETTPQPQAATVTLRAVGDIMLHEAQQLSALKKDGSYEFSEYFQVVSKELSCADITIGNLETPVANKKPSGYPRFNAPIEFLYELKAAGFDYFTLANNHILDMYSSGIRDTIKNLEANDIGFFGASTEKSTYKTVVIDVKGIKIALLGYTYGTNGHEDTAGQVRYLTEKNIKQDVASAKEQGADIIIAFPHWGSEYYEGIHDSTRKWAQTMADLGVDAILGSHPHVVEPMTQVTAADGRVVPVIHSMGNFVSNQQISPRFMGIIMQLTITKQPDGTTEISEFGYMPTFVYKYSGKAKYCYEVLPLYYAETDSRILGSSSQGKLKKALAYAKNTLDADFATALEPYK